MRALHPAAHGALLARRQLAGLAGALVVDVVFLGGDDPTHIVSSQDPGRDMAHQQRVLPDIGVGAPIGISRQPPERHNQGWRVAGRRLRPEAQEVFIEDTHRHIVFDRGVTILHQGDIHIVEGAALRDDRHAFLLSGPDEHLALFSARLDVALDAERALRLQAADMGERVVIGIDIGVGASSLGAVDGLAGGERTGRKHPARPLPFGGDKNLGGPGRGVVDRGGSQRQIDDRRPVLLRHQIIFALGAMGMGVNEPRDHRLSGEVHDFCAGRDRHAGSRA